MTDQTALPLHGKSRSSLSELFSDRRVAAALGLGFSSGLPLLLVYTTLSAWLSDAAVPIGIIGLMSESTLAYRLKFFWAPFLDRYDPPILTRLLGRRRAWILVAQATVIIGLVGIGLSDPENLLAWTVVCSFFLGFAGSTQDIVFDAWRISVAPEKQAIITSWGEIGWRIGNLVGGAGALYLADLIGWRGAYLSMAAIMLVPGMIATLFAPEPETDLRRTPETFDIVATIVEPFKDLFVRLGSMALPILLLVAGFRMPGYISGTMAVPLFKSLHYSNSDIATVTKLIAFWLALAATFIGGWMIPRIGMMTTLFIGTFFGSASHLALAWLAAHGDHSGGEFWVFAVAVSIDSFAYALASIVLIIYMSTLCAPGLAASQYALLTSLVALPGSLLSMPSGFIVEQVGYENFFIGTSLIGLPVAILALYVWRADQRGYKIGVPQGQT